MPSLTVWPDPAHPVPVEYSPEVLERIRRIAYDALLALPRVGLGAGGFLLGTSEPSRIRITDFSPIECSHSSGPSFSPTAQEIQAGRTAANAIELSIVGYYCSRPRRPIEVTDQDRLFFEELCPGSGRLLLLIRPSATEESRAAFFHRKTGGALAGGFEKPLMPLTLTSASQPVSPVPVIPPDDEPVVPEPAPREPLPPDPNPTIRIPAAPQFAVAPPKRWTPVRIAASAALVIALAAIAFFGFFFETPRPSLDLRTAELDGHFSIEWNRAAILGINRALLTVTDGPSTKTIPLNQQQLEAGILTYARQTPQVQVLLVAGPTTATAKFIAPPGPTPSPAVAPVVSK